MVRITRVLCPVDFSDCSRRALDYAAGIARWYDAGVTALHVIPPMTGILPPAGGGLYPPIVFSPEDLQQFRDELEAFARESGVAGLDTQVVQGPVIVELLRAANELPADLIVVGTHGRSGFERLMLGSVTEKLLRKAPCPVLTIPACAPVVAPVSALFSRVLCAVDFSPSSLHALAFARSLAGEAAAKLCVIHVLEPVSVFEPVLAVGPDHLPASTADARRARQKLEALVDRETRAFVEVSEVVVAGRAYREILRTAGEQESDLIVLGAHSESPGPLAFGSTPNHIVREARCPVLTVR